ncbi:Holin of 3TMs, for gene-transfer release [Cognatiyoonia sediminum]|uniref:Holin of 3TMs, for gene-transfer release n=1 Tax=Cognatiyoonia sediminum TaxID=1508389 RepID=A0A1M5LTA5_9RHOB|nr:holin family protein [Cognatiyoonia sediminum]SHG68372.1 Holin of 3TMs, for gene-transfer release [Cognatiyoonia sediminum]
MGLVGRLMTMIFGDGRNVIAETAEVFRVNSEQADQSATDVTKATLAQFAAEFAHPRKGLFDRVIDGINRLPRPMLALGTIALFVTAMFDPVWFASRMEGVALVPEPLWWLMGAIVSFYFGARHQAKGQDFSAVAETLSASELLKPKEPQAPDNPALADWEAKNG